MALLSKRCLRQVRHLSSMPHCLQDLMLMAESSPAQSRRRPHIYAHACAGAFRQEFSTPYLCCMPKDAPGHETDTQGQQIALRQATRGRETATSLLLDVPSAAESSCMAVPTAACR